MLTSLAWHSLKSRKQSVILTFFALFISLSVLLTVEHIRVQAKDSFARTINGVDLIVGAPSGQLNLLLYSVFRMGSPVNEIKYQSFIQLKQDPQVSWAIPIALGDSHKGYRVLGTNQDYFEYYKYGDQQNLAFLTGQKFNGIFETVLGYEVAKKLNYQIGDKIIIAHGVAATGFNQHALSPFVVTGILAPTGTPVDKTLHVTLAGIEAAHLPQPHLKKLLANESKINPDRIHPDSITAIMLGLKSKFSTFTVQRQLNQYPDDRLMAILPGVAMTQLWQLTGTLENLLRLISLLVLIASLIGLSTMLLASMQQRKHEINVLRILGAGPGVIFSLILAEAILLMLGSALAAIGFISLNLIVLSGWLSTEFGLFISANLFTVTTIKALGLTVIATILTALLPAIEAYRSALQCGIHSNN